MLWAELRQRPATLPVLLLCAVGLVLHQASHGDWFIDDAAICFAYARNLATGEGGVPWPGGERVEAISDPTWVLLLTGFMAAGLDGFTVAKPLGMVFGIASLVQAWRIATLALPGHRGDGALVAPAVLAANAQFAIWCASGLENSLFALLLATLCERTVRESGPGTWFPGAALAGLLLVWTRPEGIAYVAMAGGWLALFAWQQGRGWSPALRFASIVILPTAVLQLARLAYFAWPLPNPFYAKIASRGVVPLQWNSRGWWQLREWSARLWHVYYVPFYAIGLFGTSRRAWPGFVGVAVLAVSLLWPLPVTLMGLTWLPPVLPPPPSAFVVARLVGLVVALGALPLLGLARPGGRATVICAHAVVVGMLFSVFANGDWMGGYRFLSLFAVPQAVILGVGITLAVQTLATRSRDVGLVVGVVALGAVLAPNLSQTRDHRYFNRDESTRSVKQRVDHTRNVLRTTFWTEPVVTLDVDQGAHLWWAPDYRSLDMGMLVDIPMGRHWFQQTAFIEEYVFTEHRPTFAHVVGWWGQHTGLRSYAPFLRGDYVELPPYTDVRSGRPYRGVFVHRELIVAPPGEIAVDEHGFGPAYAMAWVAGEDGYLEIPGVGALGELVLQDRGREVARLPLRAGYGLLDPEDTRPGEVFRNRFAVAVPDLTAGTTLTATVNAHPQRQVER
ncbi:MAG: hypothetical protein AAF602_24360, partial [Myxococcota bacterium]